MLEMALDTLHKDTIKSTESKTAQRGKEKHNTQRYLNIP